MDYELCVMAAVGLDSGGSGAAGQSAQNFSLDRCGGAAAAQREIRAGDLRGAEGR